MLPRRIATATFSKRSGCRCGVTKKQMQQRYLRIRWEASRGFWRNSFPRYLVGAGSSNLFSEVLPCSLQRISLTICLAIAIHI